MWRLRDFPNPPILASPLACTGKVRPKLAASGRVALHPGGPMLAFVPVAFDVYRPLKPRLRWAMQCLVSFADCAGRCFPSVRKLAAFAGLSKSAVSRHLRDLVEGGVITRRRRPGGVYDYEIDGRFLPRAPVSHPRAEGVPQQPGQETDAPKQTE